MKSKKLSYEQLLLENENLKSQLDSTKEAKDSFYKDFMLFFEIIPNLLLITTSDGYFRKINRAWQSVLGYTMDELTSYSFYDFIHPDDIDNTINTVKKEFNESNKTNFINRYKCKTGGYITLEWNGILSPDGNYIFAYARDINHKIKFEAALIENESRYENIFNDNKAIMFIVDPLTKGIVDMNSSALDFYGYSKFDLSSLSVSDINIMSKEDIEQEMEKALLEKKNYFQFVHKLSNGENRNVQVYSAKIKYNKKEYLHSIVHDITAQNIAEKLLKESNEQIRQHIATKEKLFSVIAHDLRSPFNYILGLSELMLDKPKGYDNRKQNEYIEIINTSAKNTLSLLDNLLNWTSSQTGRIKFKPQFINLADIINEELCRLDSIVNNKIIIINYEQVQQVEVFSDKDMILTILRNLVTNSIKYTYKGGNINVSSDIINGFAEVIISDSRVGISQEKCKTLFDLSANETTKGTENENGSGLGLALCKEFVDKIGGKIWVESIEGKGSDFKFTIPLK